MWLVITLAAVLWPSHVDGILDGAPLDTRLEAITLGLILPALCWFHPEFLRHRLARVLVIAILLLKLGSAVAVPQEGWCLTFAPPYPMVRDSTGKPHAWDLRADWLSADPVCSAMMTRSYRDSFEVPAWFFNLPPPTDAVVRAGFGPGDIPIRIGGAGFLTVPNDGVFALSTTAPMNVSLRIDGTLVEPDEPGHHTRPLSAGAHAIEFEGTMLGKLWRVIPEWNGAAMGSMAFPLATKARPSRAERWIHPVVRWASVALVFLLIGGWLMTLATAIGLSSMLIWVVSASAAIVAVSIYAPSQAAWYTAAAMALPLVMAVRSRFMTLRGVLLLVVMPWIVFTATASAQQVGRWTLYGIGNDNFQFQRFSYRIFMQHYWLEGGQQTFWNQPLFRWIAGALHMVFGDSSVGQVYWDAAGVIVIAVFAYRIVGPLMGFAWGLAAAVVPMALVLLGPTLEFVGFGLSEISSAALIYLAALIALRNRGIGDAVAAGVLVMLGFLTRLNNLPMALAVAAFALPITLPTGALWKPREWLPLIQWRLVVGVAVGLAIGGGLLAWRAWHYTGVFSMFYGTQRDYLAVWKPGMSWSQGLSAMLSSLMMVLTAQDPARLAWHAVPLLAAALISLAAICNVRIVRDAPLPVVVLFIAACSGALVTRGWAYEGRFSIHLYGVASALCLWTIARGYRAITT